MGDVQGKVGGPVNFDLAAGLTGGLLPVPTPPPGEGMLSAEAWERFKRIVQKIKDKTAVDPDGPLVPLPDKPEPVRTVPALPLAAYLVMVRG